MHRLGPCCLLVVLFGCSGGSPASDASDAALDTPDADVAPPMVNTRYGPVVGVRGNGYAEYLGMPYAAPPIGELRFAPPMPPSPWTEPRLADRDPSPCVQQALGVSFPSSEDCLFLNVHTPDPPVEDAPVMVWIHGGAFLFGEGTQTDDGTRGDILASEHGVVVVSMNYRLGAFGFLAHPSLDASAGATANAGILDQRAALEWVRDNIADFGGDPNDVTLFGESAGGVSVCIHLASDESQPLFHRAIVQSGLCDANLPTAAEANAASVAFAERAGCADLGTAASCLRDLSPDALLMADETGSDPFAEIASDRVWWPSIDGGTIGAQFRERVAADAVADVPIIVGWNADEGTLFVLLAEQAGATVDAAAFDTIASGVAAAEGVDFADVQAQYPIGDYPDPGAALAAVLGHANLACPSRRSARVLAEAGHDVYVYRFEYPDASFQLPGSRELGAFHSAEIQYIFGHPSRFGQRVFRDDDLALHRELASRWSAFATDGAVAGDWPAFDATDERYLILDRAVETAMAADRDACALWDAPYAR